MSELKETFCENEIRERFELYTKNKGGKMNWDDARKILVEREDSIAPNWMKSLNKLNIKIRDEIDFETFIKLYRLFRLEEED